MVAEVGTSADTTSGVSEARLSSVLDTAVDGILVINDRAEILVYNKACETCSATLRKKPSARTCA